MSLALWLANGIDAALLTLWPPAVRLILQERASSFFIGNRPFCVYPLSTWRNRTTKSSRLPPSILAYCKQSNTCLFVITCGRVCICLYFQVWVADCIKQIKQSQDQVLTTTCNFEWGGAKKNILLLTDRQTHKHAGIALPLLCMRVWGNDITGEVLS